MGWIVVHDERRLLDKRAKIPSSGSLVAGRSRHADFVLEGGTISRRHAVFFHRDGADWVKDAGSKNGCTLNGNALDDPHSLADGDTLTLGSIALRYFAHEPPSAMPLKAIPAREESLDPEATPLGDTGRWRGVALVGRGGMGEVYSAFDHDLGISVAIKRLRRGGQRDSRLLRRLHAREAAIGRTIRHPNVVRVLEDGLYKGDPYLLLEWIEGASLDRQLAEDPPPMTDRIEILRQAALGLEAAHRAGVVHADLKPANLLLVPAADRSSVANLGILEEPGQVAACVSDETIDEAFGEEISRRVGLPETESFDQLPLIGREAELALLEQEATECREEGELRWVLICGELGVGKRRLVREFLLRRQESRRDDIHVIEDFSAPPDDATGLWISLLPPNLPDDPGLRRAHDRARVLGSVCELYLKPFLRGQAIRLVEQVVKHPPSARTFVDSIEVETGGSPRKIIEALKRSFEEKAWAPSGGGYRFLCDCFHPDPHAEARAQMERMKLEEKGLRDLLLGISPLGACLDFETMRMATQLDAARLYYLLEYAVKQGYLMGASTQSNAYRFSNEAFRRSLERLTEEKARRAAIERALPTIEARVPDEPDPEFIFHAARLERECGRSDLAFRYYLDGALAARSAYDRERFLECLDAARECYRSGEQKEARKFASQLEALFGAAGRGIGGLDRLRLLPTHERVKITDFGISRRYGQDDENDNGKEPWGTPRYMSPEQVRRDPLTPSSDIFSMGIMARELLEGHHPLGDLKGKSALAAILGGSVGAPTEGRSEIPTELCHLLASMLELHPQSRPTAAEVARELQAIQLRMIADESR